MLQALSLGTTMGGQRPGSLPESFESDSGLGVSDLVRGGRCRVKHIGETHKHRIPVGRLGNTKSLTGLHAPDAPGL